jgi:hypothetical protein
MNDRWKRHDLFMTDVRYVGTLAFPGKTPFGNALRWRLLCKDTKWNSKSANLRVNYGMRWARASLLALWRWDAKRRPCPFFLDSNIHVIDYYYLCGIRKTFTFLTTVFSCFLTVGTGRSVWFQHLEGAGLCLRL